MSSAITERKVDHAAAEMLEEPFIRVRCHNLVMRDRALTPHRSWITIGPIRVDAPKSSVGSKTGGERLYFSAGAGFNDGEGDTLATPANRILSGDCQKYIQTLS